MITIQFNSIIYSNPYHQNVSPVCTVCRGFLMFIDGRMRRAANFASFRDAWFPKAVTAVDCDWHFVRQKRFKSVKVLLYPLWALQIVERVFDCIKHFPRRLPKDCTDYTVSCVLRLMLFTSVLEDTDRFVPGEAWCFLLFDEDVEVSNRKSIICGLRGRVVSGAG